MKMVSDNTEENPQEWLRRVLRKNPSVDRVALRERFITACMKAETASNKETRAQTVNAWSAV
jgi:hypothetical protein